MLVSFFPKVENAEYSQRDCLSLEQGVGTAAPSPPWYMEMGMRMGMGTAPLGAVAPLSPSPTGPPSSTVTEKSELG